MAEPYRSSTKWGHRRGEWSVKLKQLIATSPRAKEFVQRPAILLKKRPKTTLKKRAEKNWEGNYAEPLRIGEEVESAAKKLKTIPQCKETNSHKKSPPKKKDKKKGGESEMTK